MSAAEIDNKIIDTISKRNFEALNVNFNEMISDRPKISVDRSQEIHIGDEIFYQAPVIFNVDVMHLHKNDKGDYF